MSAGKSVKFEISVEKLSFKYEGDLPSAERMHGDVAGALTSLMAQRMLTAPSKPPSVPPIVTVEPAGGRRRSSRRRRASVSAGTEAVNNDVAVVSEADAEVADVADRSSRRTGPGAQSLMTQLKTVGFFNTKRTNADIHGALAQKGHTFRAAELSTRLVRLTQKGVLKREMDPQRNQ